MRLWSKGLGTKYILPLDLCEADLTIKDGTITLQGIIPVRRVQWWYKMAMTEGDMIRFIRFVNQPDVTRFLVRQGGMRLWGRIIRDSLIFVGNYLASWLKKHSIESEPEHRRAER